MTEGTSDNGDTRMAEGTSDNGDTRMTEGAEKMSNADQGDIRVRMLATVNGIGDRLEVTVVESDYTFGTFIIITPDETVYLNESGEAISRDDIRVGDTLEIWYSGQVMLSYPPQTVAHKIVLTNGTASK